MPTEASEKRQIEKLVNIARPVALLLALLALKETSESAAVHVATFFLAGYFFVAVLVVAAERFARFERIYFPPEIDAIALAVFVALTRRSGYSICSPFFRWRPSGEPAVTRPPIDSLPTVCSRQTLLS
jgi:hypothetical protein